jgi:hypothetical protein
MENRPRGKSGERSAKGSKAKSKAEFRKLRRALLVREECADQSM